ncbi:hypothetical protein HWN40_10380 [Methanolobus zinderi]|uniref:DUF4935 domain-containing protein n=1 Tax=Methanolobus zinderi TaxID=536044 RepID=A0A7D5IPT9_9EURY|nr:hypothetical protein [Methanolobus zinderi]QLC50605.1 hypothetical protein HWN40_10380 [Methanolobus zinderi]
MNFSIDSNIIIGLANPKDRLHKKCLILFKDRRHDELFLCSTALKESENNFKNKINQTIVKLLKEILPIFNNTKMTKFEYQDKLVQAFKKVKSSNPGISNFLDLVYDEVVDFLQENNRDALPTFLAELGERYSQSLFKRLDQHISEEISILGLDHEHLSGIKEKTTSVYFKDTNDEKIYRELMTNLPKLEPVDFYTADREFAKKINQSYMDCLKYFGYEDGSFSCILL